MRWPWQQKRAEEREDLGNALGEFLADRAAGQPVDLARLSVAEACAGVWGRAFAAARVDGWPALNPGLLQLIGRTLLFRGEFAGALTASGMILPAASFDVVGRQADPLRWGYRLYVASPYGGSEEVLAPADSVLHVRIGETASAPWRGRSPLQGAMSDAELALAAAASIKGEAAVKSHGVFAIDPDAGGGRIGHYTGEQIEALTETVRNTPNGKSLVSGLNFHVRRLKADPAPSLDTARRTSSEEIAAAAGVPPILFAAQSDGQGAREAYRRLVRATLEPLGRIVAAEATLKAGMPVTLDFAALRASDTAMMGRAAEAFGRIPGVSTAMALELAGAILPE